MAEGAAASSTASQPLRGHALALVICCVFIILLAVLSIVSSFIVVVIDVFLLVVGIIRILLGILGIYGAVKRHNWALFVFIIGCAIIFVLTAINFIVFLVGCIGCAVGSLAFAAIVLVLTLVFFALCIYFAYVVKGRKWLP
eukprot:TRINITY_DN24428_c0_g1_i1.p1 TRINITY_DN24428_c0_g1~~TRINITY_DN24428_c0_g1_i1.p1  ORF type:complete len:154 (+),score=16.36 TRINITY_DN24428_c0_g1_i1:41-463(+)